ICKWKLLHPEYICLPPDPEFWVQQNVNDFGYIYGAEYQTNYFGPAEFENQDVPCAVCRSLTGTGVVMIPAKSSYYPNCKQEYHGRLDSGDYAYSLASPFVCVDKTPEVNIPSNNKLSQSKNVFADFVNEMKSEIAALKEEKACLKMIIKC
ncbi:hypothetical protein KUTeg_008802, partial [Tegillarca granosa]